MHTNSSWFRYIVLFTDGWTILAVFVFCFIFFLITTRQFLRSSMVTTRIPVNPVEYITRKLILLLLILISFVLIVLFPSILILEYGIASWFNINNFDGYIFIPGTTIRAPNTPFVWNVGALLAIPCCALIIWKLEGVWIKYDAKRTINRAFNIKNPEFKHLVQFLLRTPGELLHYDKGRLIQGSHSIQIDLKNNRYIWQGHDTKILKSPPYIYEQFNEQTSDLKLNDIKQADVKIDITPKQGKNNVLRCHVVGKFRFRYQGRKRKYNIRFAHDVALTHPKQNYPSDLEKKLLAE